MAPRSGWSPPVSPLPSTRRAGPTTTVLVVAAVLAVLAALADSGALGEAAKPPIFKRQVDDAWLSTYRSWVYGLGFGWQIGAGITTYIMTTAVFLTIGLAALTAGPLLAFVLAVLFGLARGLAVLLSARLRSPAAMLALHARLEALETPVRLTVIGIEVAVAAIAAGLAWGPLAAVVALVVSTRCPPPSRPAMPPARLGSARSPSTPRPPAPARSPRPPEPAGRRAEGPNVRCWRWTPSADPKRRCTRHHRADQRTFMPMCV